MVWSGFSGEIPLQTTQRHLRGHLRRRASGVNELYVLRPLSREKGADVAGWGIDPEIVIEKGIP